MSWRSTRAAAHGGQTPRQIAVIDLGSNSWRLHSAHDPDFLLRHLFRALANPQLAEANSAAASTTVFSFGAPLFA